VYGVDKPSEPTPTSTDIENKRELIRRINGSRITGYEAQWPIFPVLPAPLAQEMEEWEYLSEAKVQPNGLFVGSNDPMFKIDYNHRVEPVGKDYVVEEHVLGNRLVYNPRRAKSLRTRRSGSATNKKAGLKLEYTCMDCVYQIALIMHHYVFKGDLAIISNSCWSSNGIDSCMNATVHLWEVVKRMHGTSVVRKDIATWLRRGYWHSNRISKHDNYNKWFTRELKRIGVPKAEDKRKYQVKRQPPPRYGV
jgi:hypothetical protein